MSLLDLAIGLFAQNVEPAPGLHQDLKSMPRRTGFTVQRAITRWHPGRPGKTHRPVVSREVVYQPVVESPVVIAVGQPLLLACQDAITFEPTRPLARYGITPGAFKHLSVRRLVDIGHQIGGFGVTGHDFLCWIVYWSEVRARGPSRARTLQI